MKGRDFADSNRDFMGKFPQILALCYFHVDTLRPLKLNAKSWWVSYVEESRHDTESILTM